MHQVTDLLAARCRKPRGQGASRRAEILDAAKRLFADEGVAHVTMRRIAAAVGVSPTALYMHFTDKDAILLAIAQDTFSDLVERLQAAPEPNAPPLDRLRAGLRAYAAFGLARPDEYRLTLMTRFLPPRAEKSRVLPVADQSFAILQGTVIDLMRAGQFRPGNADQVAELIWATMHGVTALLLDKPDHLCTAPATLIDFAIDTLIAGLTAPAIAASAPK